MCVLMSQQGLSCTHVSPKFVQNAKFTTFWKVNLDHEMSTKLWNLNVWKRKRQHSQTWNLSNILHQRDSQSFSILPKKMRKSQHFWRTIENWVCFTIYFQQFISFCAFIYSNTNSHQLFYENSYLNLANSTKWQLFALILENVTPLQIHLND